MAKSGMSTLAKFLKWLLIAAVVIVAGGYVAFQMSPWPAALLIRQGFDKGGIAASQALQKHVPATTSERLNERYDPSDEDGLLDVFFPAEGEEKGIALPTIVWIHGGAWISGDKDQIANYARIVASHGYTVAGVDYTMAPAAKYPTPVRQANAALDFLVRNAVRLHVDPARLFIAGDSAGGHISAQLANVISVPSYAQLLGIKPAIERAQLRGMILFCGAYDIRAVKLDGSFGSFLRTVLWSYSGTKDFQSDPLFASASVAAYVDGAFPPSFISAGNADPLGPQSVAFARILAAQRVQVDTLFFPEDYQPPLGHEYQFDLDGTAGPQALKRMLGFVAAH